MIGLSKVGHPRTPANTLCRRVERDSLCALKEWCQQPVEVRARYENVLAERLYRRVIAGRLNRGTQIVTSWCHPTRSEAFPVPNACHHDVRAEGEYSNETATKKKPVFQDVRGREV
jgi:hypothetical protein